jgi:hypothetical protein
MDFDPDFGIVEPLFVAGAAGPQLAVAVVGTAPGGSDTLPEVVYTVYSFHNTIGHIVGHMSFDFYILDMHSFYHLQVDLYILSLLIVKFITYFAFS